MHSIGTFPFVHAKKTEAALTSVFHIPLKQRSTCPLLTEGQTLCEH